MTDNERFNLVVNRLRDEGNVRGVRGLRTLAAKRIANGDRVARKDGSVRLIPSLGVVMPRGTMRNLAYLENINVVDRAQRMSVTP